MNVYLSLGLALVSWVVYALIATHLVSENKIAYYASSIVFLASILAIATFFILLGI